MKHRMSLFFLALALLLTGCAGGGVSTDTSGSTDSPTKTPTEAPTEAPTAPPTEADTTPTRPETEADLYENGYTNRLLVGFDEMGRSIPAVGERREDKEVGIFYFLWLGQHGTERIYDIPAIRAEHGDDVLFHQDVPDISPAGAFHWWEEPLYGYYNSSDEWVIRRHMEMLTEAGVDFLVFDVTNTYIYEDCARTVMKVISELRAEGWDAPQVAWMTHSYSIRTTQKIYDAFYKTNTYPESWYCVEGKPMMISYTSGARDAAAVGATYSAEAWPSMSEELRNFFYLREPRWPFDSKRQTSWPYTEWQYPQPINGRGDDSMVSVSIATHPALPFSFSLTRGNANWGRGWDVEKQVNVAEDALRGTFFDAQWDVAIEHDPHFVFITGWNEWVAQKNLYEGEYSFVDNVDLEFSRDAEPMKGGYEDAYFIQMMTRLREYKYESMEGKIAASVRKTIDITGPVSQWEDVNAVYRRVGRDDGSRDAPNATVDPNAERYTQAPVRNNLTEIRVTVDAENLYFYIKSESDIVSVDEANWMNLFIGTGSTPTVKGWESYEFVINRSRTGSTATIEKLNADFTGEALEATATFSVQGNVMQISVPRSALGLTEAEDFYFKVADGVSDTDEIMDYYVTGRSMPMGRLSYLYQIGNLN